MRILAEIDRLIQEIKACQHCASLRGQIVRLTNILPPEPIIMFRDAEGNIHLLPQSRPGE
jgi:hypothetical protein